ncbi:MAG: serine/threonine protein kinase [Archangium sp.]|nr:serine/threonine protein kinase [Archangium sp.]
MSTDPEPLPPETAPTRPSAPRSPSATQPMPATGAARGTTLPMVRWGASGAELQPNEAARYETLELLGEGGMGEVVRARDNDIGREVAVKRLRADLQHPELFARFVEEVRTIGQLEHPNIVPIHDAGLDAQGYFFVMKRLEGESLADIIFRLDRGDAEAHTRWPFERRVDVIRKVLEALRYAHGRGVVHRDIKPANILVGPMGEVFLLDWGIAKRTTEETSTASTLPVTVVVSAFQTQAGAVMGTPLYMSPEQARGEPVDARSDLYSLCLTLYEFLTLKNPFAQHTDVEQLLQAVSTQKPSLASLVRNPHQDFVPMDLTWVLAKGLAKHPLERYQSADELIRRLDDRAEGKVPIQCHVTLAKRSSYEAMRLVNRFPVLFGLALLGGVAATVWAAVR